MQHQERLNTKIDLAKRWNQAGLLSDAGLGAVLD